ncbi:MAG: redoxin domain-containing protein [Planctomycetota bacterium]
MGTKPLAVGDLGPDFSVNAQDQLITLSSLRGQQRAALFFFPLAFTPVCRTELPELEQHAAAFLRLGCALFAISVDHPSSANAFRDFCGIRSFPVIGDYGKDIVRAYGVLRDEGFAERCTFLLDRQGVIRVVKMGELMMKRDFAEFLPLIDTLP